jgi:tetratricopeptide (TPR) repeat protein
MFTIQSDVSAAVLQVSSGPVPRGYLPGLLKITRSSKTSQPQETIDSNIIETAIGFYLDGGGRIGTLYAATPTEDEGIKKHMRLMGFKDIAASSVTDANVSELLTTFGIAADRFNLFVCEAAALKDFCEQRLPHHEGTADVLHDIIGRLLHDGGNPKEAVNSYTSGLLVNPKAAPLFRNLGSAYHACGDMQMAFASFQQALSVDPTDLLVYLKLAYLYEDLASKDWQEAAEYAQKCYQFYLDKVDAEDTSVLTRLGNLLMKDHSYEEAAAVYGKALGLNDKLQNVWFNLAHSQVRRLAHLDRHRVHQYLYCR